MKYFERLLNIARAPLGRAIVSLLGIAIVVILLWRTDFQEVGSTISRAVWAIPAVFVLEISILICTMAGLRTLYGEDRHKIPSRALVRAGLVGYAVMGLVPAGRAVAEATRATMLAQYSGGARAAAAATRLQGICLLANAAISLPATLAMYFSIGPSVTTSLISTNFCITLVLGTTVLVASRFSKIGSLVGSSAYDEHLSSKWKAMGFRAFGWEFLGRILQVIQNGVLVVAVGGALGIVPAFTSETLHLVGVAGGELMPAQLGATELAFKLSSGILHLSPSSAIAIALIAHLVQFTLVSIGLLVPVLWPVKTSPAS